MSKTESMADGALQSVLDRAAAAPHAEYALGLVYGAAVARRTDDVDALLDRLATAPHRRASTRRFAGIVDGVIQYDRYEHE